MILSVPSYVIPGTYGENVRYLASRSAVQAVELLFYFYDPDSRALFLKEKPLISSYRGRFRFSVHLPDLLCAEHEELVELTRDLAERYIVHPPLGPAEPFLRLMGRWRKRYGEVFLLENLIGRELSAPADTPEDMPLCCDTGHLLLTGGSPRAFLEKHGDRVREVHLHGVHDGADHRPFGPEEPWFQEIVPQLRVFSGVLHLEVFSVADLEACLTTLRGQGIMTEASERGREGA